MRLGRTAERHRDDDPPHPDEDDPERQQKDRQGPPAAIGAQNGHDGKLADERPERRNAANREKPRKPEKPRHRGDANHSGDGSRGLRVIRAEDGPRDEEERPLRQGVVQRVKQPSERRARSGGDREDSHVLDARIGEKALEVRLLEDEPAREEHRPQAERDEQAVAVVPYSGADQDGVRPQDAEERAVEQRARKQRRHGRRGFAVRVRQPGVHRRESHLRPVPHEDEREGDLQPHGMERRRVRREPPEGQGQAVGRRMERNRNGERRIADQRDRDAHRADQKVLPRGLEGTRRALIADHRRARKRRGLDGHPEHARMKAQDRKRRRAEKEEHGAREDGLARQTAPSLLGKLVSAQIRDRRERGRREKRARDEQEQQRKRVQPEPPSRGRFEAGRPERERTGKMKKRDGRNQPPPHAVRCDSQAREPGQKRREKQDPEHHAINPSIRKAGRYRYV